MRTPHTSCRRGKRVRVILRDGESFIAKFLEKQGQNVKFDNGRVIHGSSIKVFSIYKPFKHERA